MYFDLSIKIMYMHFRLKYEKYIHIFDLNMKIMYMYFRLKYEKYVHIFRLFHPGVECTRKNPKNGEEIALCYGLALKNREERRR